MKDALWQHYHNLGKTWGEAAYDPDAQLLRFVGWIKEWKGKQGHMTRDSLYFARILLDGGDAADMARAAGIIGKVLDTQVTREGSPVRGNYPWKAEDAEAEIWDPNWSCFNAQTLLEIVHWHAAALPAALLGRIDAALALSAEHELKRWVAPAYTNITLLTALCLGGAGQRLKDAKYQEAGLAKLRELDACVAATGALDEYNSPYYSSVNLHALSSLCAMLEGEGREISRRLWHLQWSLILRHLHPVTGQLCGPHGRIYGRDMLRSTHGSLKFLLHRSLGPAFPLGVIADGSASDIFPALIANDLFCPEDLKEAFFKSVYPRTETQVVDSCDLDMGLPSLRVRPAFWCAKGSREDWQQLIRSKGRVDQPAAKLAVKKTTAYLGTHFCLGSVSAESMGDQCAPLTAHWPQPGRADRANYFAGVALAKGKDGFGLFRGAVLCQAQREDRVLGLLRFGQDDEEGHLPEGEGVLAFHCNLDAAPKAFVQGQAIQGAFKADETVVLQSQGICIGIRMFQAEIPGASIQAAVLEAKAPYSHPQGELAVHWQLGHVKLKLGDRAYAAFAVEIDTERACGGVEGMARRLREAKLSARADGSRVKLSWEDLGLETSCEVMDYNAWLTPQGQVRSSR